MYDRMPDLLALDDEAPVLPLPALLDTPTVVLAGLLSGGTRPLILDASAVREVDAAAAGLLASLLRAKRDAGVEARIVGARGAIVRGGPLAPFVEHGPAAEAIFICPDRDELGFTPSAR